MTTKIDHLEMAKEGLAEAQQRLEKSGLHPPGLFFSNDDPRVAIKTLLELTKIASQIALVEQLHTIEELIAFYNINQFGPWGMPGYEPIPFPSVIRDEAPEFFALKRCRHGVQGAICMMCKRAALAHLTKPVEIMTEKELQE